MRRVRDRCALNLFRALLPFHGGKGDRMKVWINRKGEVESFGIGSIEEQHADLVKILVYLQRAVTCSEKIAEEVQTVNEKEKRYV